MVSSRRLAREWALKILYQIDVGKFTVSEALEAALERLRLEFVQRGSRTASGSKAEEHSLDFVTRALGDMLPTLSPPLERALAAFLGRLFEEVPYWQELRLERALHTQAPGVLLDPPRLLTPLSDSYLLPMKPDPADGLAVRIAALTPEERARFLDFADQMRTELPRILALELRQTARTAAKELATNRPLGAVPEVLHAYQRTRREELMETAARRWRGVGEIVQKQTDDWLRTAAFTVKLVTGTHEKQADIDQAIAALAPGWRLERQVAVDRNILRLAGFEILFLPGVPTGASINEAVELAKKYSTAESGRFVNGVLGTLAARVGKKVTPAAEALEPDLQDDNVDVPDIADIEELEAG